MVEITSNINMGSNIIDEATIISAIRKFVSVRNFAIFKFISTLMHTQSHGKLLTLERIRTMVLCNAGYPLPMKTFYCDYFTVEERSNKLSSILNRCKVTDREVKRKEKQHLEFKTRCRSHRSKSGYCTYVDLDSGLHLTPEE